MYGKLIFLTWCNNLTRLFVENIEHENQKRPDNRWNDRPKSIDYDRFLMTHIRIVSFKFNSSLQNQRLIFSHLNIIKNWFYLYHCRIFDLYYQCISLSIFTFDVHSVNTQCPQWFSFTITRKNIGTFI